MHLDVWPINASSNKTKTVKKSPTQHELYPAVVPPLTEYSVTQ